MYALQRYSGESFIIANLALGRVDLIEVRAVDPEGVDPLVPDFIIDATLLGTGPHQWRLRPDNPAFKLDLPETMSGVVDTLVFVHAGLDPHYGGGQIRMAMPKWIRAIKREYDPVRATLAERKRLAAARRAKMR